MSKFFYLSHETVPFFGLSSSAAPQNLLSCQRMLGLNNMALTVRCYNHSPRSHPLPTWKKLYINYLKPRPTNMKFSRGLIDFSLTCKASANSVLSAWNRAFILSTVTKMQLGIFYCIWRWSRYEKAIFYTIGNLYMHVTWHHDRSKITLFLDNSVHCTQYCTWESSLFKRTAMLPSDWSLRLLRVVKSRFTKALPRSSAPSFWSWEKNLQ